MHVRLRVFGDTALHSIAQHHGLRSEQQHSRDEDEHDHSNVDLSLCACGAEGVRWMRPAVQVERE